MRLWRCWPLPSNNSKLAYSELRAVARSLALATLFDKPKEQEVACDLIQLGLELDKIIDIASEPMLAMIRMQWWLDLFEAEMPLSECPDFAKRLHNSTYIENQNIIAIIQETQDSLQLPIHCTSWAKLFEVICLSNGWQVEKPVLQKLGQNFNAINHKELAHHYEQVSDKDIKAASGAKYGLFRLLNLVMQRQMSGKPTEDYLLIFRFLKLVLL